MSANGPPSIPPELPDCEKLAALQHFTPKVFQADAKDAQEVCNFVLMLALINNDFKDLLWSYSQLDKCRKDAPLPLTAYNGQYSGIRGHLTRLTHSLFFELAKLVQENTHILDHPLFLETIRKIHKQNKDNWDQLVGYATGSKGQALQELRDMSCLIRNNIAFHYYQPKFLAGGYQEFFDQNNKPENQNAFISRGNSLQSTRFYFADAAVEGCFERYIGKEKAGRLRPALNKLSEALVQALYDIVDSFTQLRLIQLKDGYRDYSGETR